MRYYDFLYASKPETMVSRNTVAKVDCVKNDHRLKLSDECVCVRCSESVSQ